jgi:molybdopterin synthase catalytic subunit
MIELRRQDFSIDETIEMMKSPQIGAIAIYVGTVRQTREGVGLLFEDDDRAAQKLKEVEKRTLDRFDIEDVAIIHRVGFLGISENILLIAVSAAHRGPAFDACQSIIEDIKRLHKSWGKEVPK